MSGNDDSRPMATKARHVDIGTARGAELIARAGREVRHARRDRGLSLAATGRACGLSASVVSRIERGLVARVSVHDLARLHAVVGLELSLKSYPAGQPIRDVAHVALLEDLRNGLHKSLRWSIEVPLPIPGDRRAWDALIRGDGWQYGVEAETAPRDSQAVARRVQLKERDGRVDGVLLLLRATVQTRRFVREAGELLRSAFPIDGARALELLRAGVDPGGNAVIVLPSRPSSRSARQASNDRDRDSVCRHSNFAATATTRPAGVDSCWITPDLLLPPQRSVWRLRPWRRICMGDKDERAGPTLDALHSPLFAPAATTPSILAAVAKESIGWCQTAVPPPPGPDPYSR